VLRVTADTNIIVSGLNFRQGKSFQFLQLARAGKINFTVSEAFLDEVTDVLARKFDWAGEDIAEARTWIAGMARTVKPAVQLAVIKEDSCLSLLLYIDGSALDNRSWWWLRFWSFLRDG
jgi:predicted nucleic acid-binding protein